MNGFSFHYGPRLVAGAGTSGRIGDWIGPGPVLFVTDTQITSLGLAASALAALREGKRHVRVFDAVEADPSQATVEAAVAAGREAGVASVVGFGGGSPMDVAKLTAHLLGSSDKLDLIFGVDRATGPGLPLVLVPTTAGTGSEATPVAIVTVSSGEKRGVSSRHLIAGYALLDPTLTLTLPRNVTAATGMDAMVHAIEAYTSARLKNPVSDMLARQALQLLADNLLTVCTLPGDVPARSAMLLGAHLAGVAFANAPVAGVHALAYPLGGIFHVPHGLSNVLMLPHVLGFNMPAAMSLYAELGPLADATLTGQAPEQRAWGLVNALQRMAAAAGMPSRLRQVGVTANDLDRLAMDAMRQERLLINNPRPIGMTDARHLYEAAL
jgi:alcohol dehydrogenase class IV